MSYKEIKTLKKKVEYCLKNYPQTRNSDIELTLRVWKQFYGQYIEFTDHSKWGYLNLDKLGELPRQSAVKRVRAKFQNEDKKYIPTSWEVAKQRQFEEDEWRVAMGYPTKKTSGTVAPSYRPESEKDKDREGGNQKTLL